METMTPIVLVYSIYLVVQGSIACHSGREDCLFEVKDSSTGQYRPTLCSWTTFHMESRPAPSPYHTGDHAVGLAPNQDYGQLNSAQRCSTNNHTKCFYFFYYFISKDAELSVSTVNNKTGEKTKRWTLTATSSSTDWSGAYVPINTDYVFSVQFEARRPSSSGENVTVYIDAVIHDAIVSSCTLQPPNAAVTRASTSPTTTTTTTTTRKTTTTPTTTTPRKTTTTTSGDITTTASHPEHSVNVDVHIGFYIIPSVIIAVLIAIIVVGVIFFKRRDQARMRDARYAARDEAVVFPDEVSADAAHPENDYMCIDDDAVSAAAVQVSSHVPQAAARSARGGMGQGSSQGQLTSQGGRPRAAARSARGGMGQGSSRGQLSSQGGRPRAAAAAANDDDDIYSNPDYDDCEEGPIRGPNTSRASGSRAARAVVAEVHAPQAESNPDYDDCEEGPIRGRITCRAGGSRAAAAVVTQADYINVPQSNPDYDDCEEGPIRGQYSSVGALSPPNPYSTLGATPTPPPTNVYSSVGALSPPNVYLSIGQVPKRKK